MTGKKKAIHVVPNPDGGWDSKKDNAERASGHFETKAEAEKAAREQARREKTEIIIHDKKGRIKERDSYGNDPFPPKDKK